MSGDRLRFGVLGAAKIAPDALLKPAAGSERALVVAIAARDPERARAFAREHGIARVDPSYEALVRDPEVDAVYNPLPASLHAAWTLAALAQGKHVLCEKPFAANAAEAERMVEAARESGLVLLEAFHYRYHPLAHGSWRSSGAGCSAISSASRRPSACRSATRRTFATTSRSGAARPWTWAAIRFTGAGSQPGPSRRCFAPRPGREPPGIDVAMTAELRFPGDVRGKVHCSMAADVGFQAFLQVTGSEGELRADNPLVPHFGHRLRLSVDGSETSEQVEGRTTYDHQLEAFVAAVLDGAEQPTGGGDGIANMRVIDAIYRAAGMQPRGASG